MKGRGWLFSPRIINEAQQNRICSGLRFNTICMYLSNICSVQHSWEVNPVAVRRFTVKTAVGSRACYCVNVRDGVGAAALSSLLKACLLKSDLHS